MSEAAATPTVPLGKQIRGMKWNFWIANLIESFERLAFFGVRAVVGLYIFGDDSVLHLSMTEKGMIFGIWALIQCLVPMVSGGYTDSYGYRKSMYVAFSINIVGYCLMANVAPLAEYFGDKGWVASVDLFKWTLELGPNGFWLMLISASLVGLGTAIFKPPVQGSVAKSLNEGNSGLGFGIFYWMVNVGGFFAPMAAAVLRGNEENPTWEYVFYGAAVATAINFIPATFMFREPKLDPEARKKKPMKVFKDTMLTLWRDKYMLRFLLIVSGFWFMFMQLWDLLPNFIDEWVDTRDVGAFIAGPDEGEGDDDSAADDDSATVTAVLAADDDSAAAGPTGDDDSAAAAPPIAAPAGDDDSAAIVPAGDDDSAADGATGDHDSTADGAAGDDDSTADGAAGDDDSAAADPAADDPDWVANKDAGFKDGVADPEAAILAIAAAEEAAAREAAGVEEEEEEETETETEAEAETEAVAEEEEEEEEGPTLLSREWFKESFVLKDGRAKPELLINIDALTILLLVLPLSWFFGRYRMMVSLVLGMGIALVGFVGSGLSQAGAFVGLMIFVFAIGEIICSPKFSEYIGMTAPPDKKAIYMGYSNIPFAIGWAGGNWLSGPLYDWLSSRTELARKFLVQGEVVTREVADKLEGEALLNAVAVQMGEGTTIWDVKKMLWDTYHPWSIWLVLGCIGLASVIGMYVSYRRTQKAA